MNAIRVECANRHNLFNLNHTGLAAGSGRQVEIARCLAENEVTAFVRLPRLNDRQIGKDTAFKDIILTVEILDFLALGNLRTNAAGQDLNRAWQAPSAERSPEVLFVQQQMARIGVDGFLDIHGDEEIPHVFAAGCEGNPGFSPRLDALEQEFRERLVAAGEFQTAHGYPRDEPGQANLALACNWVGQTYDCLAFTVEMPFKDHDDNPQPRTGWNGARSKGLAQAVLRVLAALAPCLR